MNSLIYSSSLTFASRIFCFFVDKIKILKEGINPEFIEDPLKRLQQKKKLKFSLKKINVKDTLRSLKKLNKKRVQG